MKLKFLVKIESNIKKTHLKMQNYTNPDTNVFHWRKRIRQMRWSEFGGADPDRVCSDEDLTVNSCAHQLFSAAHRGFSQIYPWSLQACTLNLCLQL